MIYSNQNMDRIRDRLVALSITPSDAGNIVKQFSIWADNSGIEWAVTRMKTLKNFYVHWKFNSSYTCSDNLLPFFKKENGLPTGIFRRLMLHYGPGTVLKVLNFYSSFTLNKPSATQLKKFYQSMQRDLLGTPYDSRAKALGRQARSTISDYSMYVRFRTVNKNKYTNFVIDTEWNSVPPDSVASDGTKYHSVSSAITLSDHGRMRDLNNDTVRRGPIITDWITSATRRAPILESIPGLPLRIFSECEEMSVAADHLQYISVGVHYFPELRDREINHEICGNSSVLNTAYQQSLLFEKEIEDISVPTDVVGKVSFIQENGCKLRAVANPFRVVQALSFKPAMKLWSTLKELEQHDLGIYTYNQEKGLAKVQEFLNQVDPDDEETKVFSIDLSDATNNFPWNFQEEMLGIFLKEEEISILSRISKGSWLCPDGKYRKFVMGQPLGAYFSFASFSLAHLSLALTAHRVVYPNDYNPSNRIAIVGDDIVLRGKTLADRYRLFLSEMSVPISESKSISSFTTSEFLSKIVCKDKIYQVPKWREVNALNAYALAAIDPSCYAWMSPHIKEVVEWSLSLPEPLGLGRNPKGLSFEERIKGVEDLWFNASNGVNHSYTLNPSAYSPSTTQKVSAFYEYNQSCSSADFPNNGRYSIKLPDLADRHVRMSVLPTKYHLFVELMRQGLVTSADITSLLEKEDNAYQRGLTSQREFLKTKRALEKVLVEMYIPTGPTARGSHLSMLRRMYRKHKVACSHTTA